MSTDLPPIIGGRYQPLRLIGRGGMGLVYEVEHRHTGERLALKVIAAQSNASGESVERFKREARASARIKSENVVRVTDADVAEELDGAPYLVMELLDGADLERHAGSRPQSPADVVAWLDQIGRALDRAHALGIVHRDLKPENLFLTRRDDGAPLVKILDFGIAKMTSDVGAPTQSGQMLGTPWYMAPEQAQGAAITPKTDLFSLGLIAYRLLVGAYYWRGKTLPELVNELCYKPMPPASERGATLGAAFDAWFARACDRAPEKRFASAAELVGALAKALGVEGRPAPALTPPSSAASLPPISEDEVRSRKSIEQAPTLEASASVITAARTARRSRAPVAVVAAIVVAGGIAAALVARSGREPSAAGAPSAAPVPSPLPSPSQTTIAIDDRPPAASSPPAPSAAPSASASTTASAPRPPPRAVPSPKPKPSAPGRDPLADQK